MIKYQKNEEKRQKGRNKEREGEGKKKVRERNIVEVGVVVLKRGKGIKTNKFSIMFSLYPKYSFVLASPLILVATRQACISYANEDDLRGIVP